jgi:apolipoprotein N-acyltransferase
VTEDAASRGASPEPAPLARGPALGLATLAGVLIFLGFAGFDVWPLAFVAWAPLLVAVRRQEPSFALKLGLLAGLVLDVGGFYWLQTMLVTFSGFPPPVCAIFTGILCAYQGGRAGLFAWLLARAERRGWPFALVVFLAFAASETVYPVLFPWYVAGSVHMLPTMMQVAELGGPVLVSLCVVAPSVAIAELVDARLSRRPLARSAVLAPLALTAAAALFGVVRLGQVRDAMAAAEPFNLGLVQGNLGLIQKREDPAEGLRRHRRLTAELVKEGADLVVWSESSITFPMPVELAPRVLEERMVGGLGVPVVAGAVLYERAKSERERERWFNVAVSTDANGKLTGRFDKTYLLAFGEFLPFGETFPALYELSPNTGHFTAGSSLAPLRVEVKGKERSLTALICYEDILPGFARDAVKEGEPDLLVNLTNDAWFGDTTEPWEHLALAKLRAVEHRRYLVRATNSGVSAIVDPTGAVVGHTKTYEAAKLMAEARFMRAHTVFERLGLAPWYLLALGTIALAFAKRAPRVG